MDVIAKFINNVPICTSKEYFVTNKIITSTQWEKNSPKQIVKLVKDKVKKLPAKLGNNILAEMKNFYGDENNYVTKNHILSFCELIDNNLAITKEQLNYELFLYNAIYQVTDNHYQANIKWLFEIIREELEISKRYPIEEVMPEYFWKIGLLNNKTPIFFARKLSEQSVFENLHTLLDRSHERQKGIIITSSKDFSFAYTLPRMHIIIPINKCMLYSNSDKFSINRNIFKYPRISHNTEECFSNGFRSMSINGECFTFTQTEAEVLEYIHFNGYKKGMKLHKDEIMANISESNIELRHLFRGKESLRFREMILNHDANGFYWLDI